MNESELWKVASHLPDGNKQKGSVYQNAELHVGDLHVNY
jgi:hypothetical protein